jgi:hypothetical protein
VPRATLIQGLVEELGTVAPSTRRGVAQAAMRPPVPAA